MRGVISNTTRGGLQIRFVSKVSVVLVMVPVLFQATGDSALGASNCGFLTIEQCRATSAASVDFACPINFTILKGLTKAATNDKRYAPIRLRSLSVVRPVFGPRGN